MTVFNSLLNETYHVARRRRVSDGRGGWRLDYAEIDPVEGRMRPANSAEMTEAMQQKRRITHVLYTVAGVDLARGDVISRGTLTIDGSTVTADDILVEIDAVRNPSEADHHWEIDGLEKQVETANDEFYRLLETGDRRLLETGSYLLVE